MISEMLEVSEAPRMMEALRLYADWGRSVSAVSEQITPSHPPVSLAEIDLGAVRYFVDDFARFSKSEAERMRGLLARSDSVLRPLADPLRLGFSEHRWFHPDRIREESYSDWFAWLLHGCRSACPAAIWRIVGLDEIGSSPNVVANPIDRVTREKCITTDLGTGKRMDIVCWTGEIPTLVIEVKVGSIEAVGGKENLPIYERWQLDHCPDSGLRGVRRTLILPETHRRCLSTVAG